MSRSVLVGSRCLSAKIHENCEDLSSVWMAVLVFESQDIVEEVPGGFRGLGVVSDSKV